MIKQKKHTLHITLVFLMLAPFSLSASETMGTSSPLFASSTVTTTKAKLFTSCSQDAIEQRDTKLAAARTSYNNAMNTLLIERKNSEKEAVAIADEKERKEVIKKAVEEYKNEVKSVQNTLTQARKSVWQNFENDMKLCRDNLDKENKAEAKDELLEIKRGANEEASDAKSVVINKKSDTKEDISENKQEVKTMKESFIDSIKSLFGKE